MDQKFGPENHRPDFWTGFSGAGNSFPALPVHYVDRGLARTLAVLYARHMVGNEIDAANAHAGEYVGEGCSRIVYRIGDVVYKVNTTEFNSNLDEYLAGERLRGNVPAPFIVPPMTMHGDVLAMPYYDGTMSGECYCLPIEACSTDCMPETLASVARSIGCDVATWGNTVTVGEDIYLIDLGSES